MLVGEGKFSLNTVVTGMVVAVKGTSLKGGEFDVEDISYCDIPAQLPLKRGTSLLKIVAVLSQHT